MPVEIVAEYENWRKIRDWQGASGWVHQSLLTGKRTFIIPAKQAALLKTPATSAEVVLDHPGGSIRNGYDLILTWLRIVSG